MFSAHFAQLKWENHHPPPQNFLELLRILPSIQRSTFLADSMRVSTKSESECLTPPAGLKRSLSIVNFERRIASMPDTEAGQPFFWALAAQLRTTQFTVSCKLPAFT